MLVPQYMHSFRCIGGECEDTCCVGWNVWIDRDTYKKYKKTTHRLFAENEQVIKRNKNNTSKFDYANIRMNESGACPFLSEEKLCRIHEELGEDFLCSTCAIYPRTFNLVNDVVEKSGTLSCPEIARLVLLNPNGIEFDEIEGEVEKKAAYHSALHLNNEKGVRKYFWPIRVLCIQILQDRRLSLEERLIVLGMFLKKISENKDHIDVMFEQICQYTYQMLDDLFVKQHIATLPKKLGIQLSICQQLIEIRKKMGLQNNKYVQYLEQMIQGFGGSDNIERMAECYEEGITKYYEPFMKEKGYMLENYLVNYVFKNLFPIDKEDVFDSYVMIVVHYTLIRLHLIGIARFHRGLNEQLVVMLIQSFSKTIEHNKQYLKTVLDILRANDINSMSFMTVLINS
nr:flagellin lysine-N-methylase [Anoxybacillus sp. EFIL]